jgi:hypothetical protein
VAALDLRPVDRERHRRGAWLGGAGGVLLAGPILSLRLQRAAGRWDDARAEEIAEDHRRAARADFFLENSYHL